MPAAGVGRPAVQDVIVGIVERERARLLDSRLREYAALRTSATAWLPRRGFESGHSFVLRESLGREVLGFLASS